MNDLIEKVNNMRWGGKYTTEDIIALMRDCYGYKDPTMVNMGTAHEADIRADERQLCIDAIMKVKPVDVNLHQSTNDLYYMHDMIEALEKQE